MDTELIADVADEIRQAADCETDAHMREQLLAWAAQLELALLPTIEEDNLEDE